MAGAAAVWALSEVARTVAEVVLSNHVGAGSMVTTGFLAAAPLEVAAAHVAVGRRSPQ